MKIFVAASFATALLGTSAPAGVYEDQLCQGLWFSRNAMLDQAGQCFSSPLGRSVFDNADCSPGSAPKTTAMQNAFINWIRLEEAALSCSVNTNRTALDQYVVQDLKARLDLDVQPPVPATSESEFSCIGYAGGPVEVLSAPASDARVLTVLEDGDLLDFDHPFDTLWTDALFKNWPSLARNAAAFPRTDENSGWSFVGISDAPSDDTQLWGWAYLPKTGFLAPVDVGGVCRSMAG